MTKSDLLDFVVFLFSYLTIYVSNLFFSLTPTSPTSTLSSSSGASDVYKGGRSSGVGGRGGWLFETFEPGNTPVLLKQKSYKTNFAYT